MRIGYKIFIITSLGLILTLSSIVMVSYQLVQKLTNRCVSTAISQKKIDSLRERIIVNYGAQAINMITSDRIVLDGLLIERSDAQRVILICHGYHQTKQDMYRYINLFPHDTLLLFDFRGHGASSGELITLGYYESRDIQAAIQFLIDNGYAHQRCIIGCGHSMGAAALLMAQSQYNLCDGLILDSPFSRLYDSIDHLFAQKARLPRFPFLYVALWLYACKAGVSIDQTTPLESAKMVECPVLLIHAHKDSFTPVVHTLQIYSALTTSVKELYISNCDKHVKSIKYCLFEYQKRVKSFMDRVRSSQLKVS